MKKVFLFTKDNCAPCKMVKQYIKDNGIEATEFDVFESPDSAVAFEVMSVPTTILIEDYNPSGENDLDSDSVTVVRGFDMTALETIKNKVNK